MAQAPIIQWQKSLGGSGNDYANSVQQTADGGYIVAGYTSSNDGDVSGNHGGDDIWVVKLTATGTVAWSRTLGGSGIDAATSVRQMADGGYIVGCYTLSENSGDIIGNRGGADYWIVKLTSTGNIDWSRCLGGQSSEYMRAVQLTADGGYVMGGYTSSIDGDVSGNHGNVDYWVVKLDNIQEIQWKKTYGGTGTDILTSIVQTTDGGYIVAGHVYSQDGDIVGSGFHGPYFNDYWVVKLSSTGAIQWKKALGGYGNDHAQSVQQTADGGYIVFGFITSNDGDVSGNNGYMNYWIVKLSSQGVIQWQKALGGSGQEGFNAIPDAVDGAHSIQQTTDLGYVLAGYSKSNDGDVSGNHGGFDYWVVKLANPLSTDDFLSKSVSVYPNPASERVFVHTGTDSNLVQLSLYGLLGQLLRTTKENSISVSELPKGVYFLQVKTDKGEVTKKIVVE